MIVELLERHLERVTLDSEPSRAAAAAELELPSGSRQCRIISARHLPTSTITVPWTEPCAGGCQRHHPRARAQHADEAVASRGPADRDCEGARLGRRVGSTAGLAASPCLPGAKERSSGTSGCCCRSLSFTTNCREPSSKGRRRQVSPSRRWLARCPGPGPSRSGALLYVR